MYDDPEVTAHKVTDRPPKIHNLVFEIISNLQVMMLSFFAYVKFIYTSYRNVTTLNK